MLVWLLSGILSVLVVGRGSELSAGAARDLPDAAIDTGFVIAQNSSVVIKDG